MNITTLDDALDELLGDRRTGDQGTDLREAAREVWRRRKRNTVLGALVLAVLTDPYAEGGGLSLRDVERETGIPRTTVTRWSVAPERADADRPDPESPDAESQAG